MNDEKATSVRYRGAGAVIVTIVLALGGVLGFSAPAAAAAPAGCDRGLACFYSGYDYQRDWWQGGAVLFFRYCVDDFRNYGINDVASSVYNNGVREGLYMAADLWGTGRLRYVPRDSGYANLSSIGWNDTITSAHFEGSRASARTYVCE
ncbi:MULTISPECIES: peptidase inhibitor family I36 protein [unclassified Microbacterium]|uniref:peptidase inhibitor family I36 protein n=1 Tax=unclassified Microbacterium TaxID=2609290 RepID=UPI00300FB975